MNADGARPVNVIVNNSIQMPGFYNCFALSVCRYVAIVDADAQLVRAAPPPHYLA